MPNHCVGWRSPLPLCVPSGPPCTLGEELETASGLAAGALSCEREVPLSPRLWKMLWCPRTSGTAQVAEQLLFCCHLFGTWPPVSQHGLPGLPALGRQHVAAGAVVASLQMQNDGQASTSLSDTWVGTRECHWQTSGDKLHSSFGVYPKFPMAERSRMFLAWLQMHPVQLLCSGRGLAGGRSLGGSGALNQPVALPHSASCWGDKQAGDG